jgi:hypothetical protein
VPDFIKCFTNVKKDSFYFLSIVEGFAKRIVNMSIY